MSNKKPVERVGIIGGGTAGYLTALALRKSLPNLSVTLIESDKIPVIGVGEATTFTILNFLHKSLGIDIAEFYREVKPTHKHGIRFEWGLPGDYHFNFPFEKQDSYGSHYISNDTTLGSLQSILMNEGKSLLYEHDGEIRAIESISKGPDYAYHLDNSLFISFLKKKALASGIRHLNEEVIEVIKTENKNEIHSIITNTGATYSFDLFIDCSGFRSLLLEKTLKSSFIDYSKSLFTDSAIVSSIPNFDKIKPYTTASTMKNGWLWNIPLHKNDHIGYVFSSNFCSKEEALQELELKHPELSDPRFIKFRSGRHQNSFQGNVMAIGNSFAFIEPLESTGIHMITASIEIFLDNFPKNINDISSRAKINTKLNQKWDHLKWFLALHFKYNNKVDSPFWRANREEVDLSGYDEIVELYKENGPLRKEENIKKNIVNKLLSTSVFRLNGLDTFFVGQGIFPDEIDRTYLEQRSKSLKGKTALWNKIIKSTISHKEALALIEQNPSLVKFKSNEY
jgi:tryptophan halogenase